MTKAKRIKAKAAHERLRIKKEQELEARSQLDEPEEEQMELPMESEEIEKDYMGDTDYAYAQPLGPTSFEELDAQRDAYQRAEEVSEVTWDVQSLVRNILYSPLVEAGDKSAKIKKVADEFEERVAEAMLGDALEKDMDLLQIEAMLAADARHTSLIQKTIDTTVDLVKRKLSAAGRKNLSSSDFALPDKKKYPIHDKAHVRNALARAAQQIKAGEEGAADAKAALPKIRAAAKKFGIDASLEKNAILIEKDAKGDWRWIGKPTNNFIDWDEDILSKSAHENYVAWLDANPDQAPVFLTWHTPGTARANPADFWMEKDGAVIMSGILTEGEAAALLKAQKETDLGMSFQGVGLRLDPDDARVVTHYWMYEVSDLPLDRAANPFTTLETMTKEVGMDKLQYLTTIMGSEEKAKTYLEKTGQVQKELQAAGITSKEKETPEAATAASVSTSATQATPPEPALDFKVIFEKVAKELDIDGLNAFVAQAQEDHEKVGVLEGVVKELRAGFDDKLAEVLTPPAARYAWSQANRPSASDATKLKKGSEAEEDEKLSKAAPGVPEGYWLSEISGIAPVQAQQQ